MKVYCPHCETTLEAPEEFYGKLVQCSECDNELSISEENFKPTMEDKPQMPPSPKSRTKITNRKSEPGLKVCPFCHENVLAGAVKCKHCHEFFKKTKKPYFDSLGLLLTLVGAASFIGGLHFLNNGLRIVLNANSAIHEILGYLAFLIGFVLWGICFILTAVTKRRV